MAGLNILVIGGSTEARKMQAFLYVGYLLLGFLQFFAIWDFLSSGDGGFFSFIGAALLAGVPIVGGALGVLGAHDIWGWSWGGSIALMFGPLLLLFVVAMLSQD